MYDGALVTIMVADMDRAVRFYTETLGLSLKVRMGNGWAEIQAPGLLIGLHGLVPQAPPPRAGTSVSIGLGVADIEAAVATLQQKGVQFHGPIADGTAVRLAHFADPDGTPLYLSQETGR